MQEKVSIMGVWCGLKNLSLGITVRHHSASLVMPISDPRDRFFYPHHTPMKDTYYLTLTTCTFHTFDVLKGWITFDIVEIYSPIHLEPTTSVS